MKDKDGKEIPEPTAEELEKARVEEIEAVGKKFADRVEGGATKMQQMVKDAVELHIDAKRFKGGVYDMVTDSKPLETPDSFLGLNAKEVEKYSVLRVIQSQIQGSNVKADFERECSEAISKAMGKPQGIWVPFEIQAREYASKLVKRSAGQTVGSATIGGNLVGDTLLASSFIELLRNKTLAYQLGVRRMPGLVGTISIPRQTSAGTWYWVAEDTAPAAQSAAAFDQVDLTPRTGGAYYDYSRKLMLQSTPGIEGLVMDDLVNIARIGVDLSVFHGSGTTQPTGICATSGIGSVEGANFGWPEAVEFETDVAEANADAGSMAFVTTPAIRGALKVREKVSGYPSFICEAGDRVNGYPLFITNQITAKYLLFGDFSQCIVGEWGGLDILVDPYTASSTGTVRVRGFVTIDVALRHVGAFSLCNDFA